MSDEMDFRDGVEEAQHRADEFEEAFKEAAGSERTVANIIAELFTLQTDWLSNLPFTFKFNFNFKFKANVEGEANFETNPKGETKKRPYQKRKAKQKKQPRTEWGVKTKTAAAIVGLMLAPSIIYPVAAAGLFAYTKYFDNSAAEDTLQRALCNTFPSIHSADGEIIGVLIRQRKGCDQPASIAALAKQEHSRDFRIYLEPKEGAIISWFGADPLGGARITKKVFTNLEITGASNPLQQISRSINATSDIQRQNIFERLYNKSYDAVVAAGLTAHTDEATLVQYASTFLICKIGGGEMPIAGIELCSQQIFEKPYNALSMVEKTLLVGTVKWPMIRGSEDRWDRIIKEALITANALEMGELTETTRAQLKKEIRAYPMPDIGESVIKKGQSFLGNGLASVTNEMKLAYGDDYLSQSRVQLSVSGNNASFVEEIKSGLSKIQNQHPSIELCLTHDCEGASKADVLGLVVKDGVIHNFHSSGHPDLLSGPIVRDQTSNWKKGIVHRSQGSIGKAFGSVLLAQEPRLKNLCNKSFSGVRNPGRNNDAGVAHCSDHRAWKTLREAFRKSDNLPIIWGLNQLDKSKIETLLDELKIQPFRSDVSLAYQIAFGHLTASPAQTLQYFAAAHAGIIGKKAISSEPNLILAPDDIAKPSINLEKYFTSKAAQKRVKTALTAPLNGTLYKLSHIFKKYGINDAIGKSGTSETPPPNESGVRDKLMVSAFTHNGSAYQVYLLVGSSNPAEPLGHNIDGQAFSPIWETLIKTAITNDKGAK